CFNNVKIILAHSPNELKTKTISLIEKKKIIFQYCHLNLFKEKVKLLSIHNGILQTSLQGK
ncbi:MAG TPA: hypothetical protein PKD51_09820, partial [Saprospiraceae bacterium]|nr:hypothetical protein [Saprospiraceae bacterium]